MNISSISANIVRQYNLASNNSMKQLEKLTTGNRVNSASDSPSSIGTIERNKSLINEKRILATTTNPSAIEVKAINAQVSAINGRESMNMEVTEESMRSYVNSLKTLSSFTATNGTQIFQGDPEKFEQITITTPASKTSATSELQTFTLTNDSVENVNGVDVEKASFNFTSNGESFSLKLNAGTYTANDLASALNTELSKLSDAPVNVSVKDNQLTFESKVSGSTQSLTFEGNNAQNANLVVASGVDESTEVVDGDKMSVIQTYSGREVSYFNAEAAATKLESALNSGDMTEATKIYESTQTKMKALETVLNFTENRLNNDSQVLLSQASLLEDQNDTIQKVDVLETSKELAKQQLIMQQSAWAMKQVTDMQTDLVKTLLGKN